MLFATLLGLLPPQPTPTATPASNPYLEPSAIITYVAIGVGAILTIICIIIYLRQLHYEKRREYKELSFSKLADTSLVSVDTRAEREKIQIYYDKKEVKDIHLLLLQVRNSGTLDTKIYKYDEQTEAFEKPYWFIFEGRTVIARSVLETEPHSGIIEEQYLELYHQNPDSRTDAISLPHCLLKPKASFTLRVLLTGLVGEIKTEGALVNCELKEYKLTEERAKVQFRLVLITTLLFTLLFVMYVLSLFFISHLNTVLIEIILTALIIFIAIITAMQLTNSLIKGYLSKDD